jgi:ketosteroid isomerase-like protein
VITETLSEAILGADAAFFEALIDGDIQALEGLLGEHFLIVDVASGTVHSRSDFLEAIGGGMVTFEQIRTFPAETDIRLAGPGAGIVVGRTAMSLVDAEGAPADIASRYTHVFHADGGKWRLLTAQGTPITDAAERLESGSLIRPARAADEDAVRRVAQRDSRAVPDGDLLIAVVDGEVQAAIALDGGDVIADPFRRTEELVRMLALRRLQMQREALGSDR